MFLTRGWQNKVVEMVSLFRRARYPCVFAALLLSAAQCDCFVRSTASSSTPTRQVPDTPWSKSKSSSNRQHSPSTEEYDDQALAINMQVVKLRKRTGGGRPTRLVASRAKSLVDSVKRDIFTKSNAGSVDESGHTAEDDSAFGSTVASRKLSQLELRGGIKRDAQSALGRLRLRSPAVLIRGAGTGATVGADDGGSRGTGWANAAEGLKNGLASGLAAAAVKTVLQPFDTMKTVQQFSTSRLVRGRRGGKVCVVFVCLCSLARMSVVYETDMFPNVWTVRKKVATTKDFRKNGRGEVVQVQSELRSVGTAVTAVTYSIIAAHNSTSPYYSQPKAGVTLARM